MEEEGEEEKEEEEEGKRKKPSDSQMFSAEFRECSERGDSPFAA